MRAAKIVIICFLSIVAFLLFGAAFILWKSSDIYPKSEHTEDITFYSAVVQDYMDCELLKLNVNDELLTEIDPDCFIDKVVLKLNEYTIFDYISGHDREYNLEIVYNEDKLKDELSSICVEGKDACVTLTSTGVILEKEILERKLDIDKLCDLITRLDDFTEPVNIDAYVSCNTLTSSSLQSEYNEVAWLNDWHIHYTNGYTVDYSYLYDYLTSGREIDWNNAISNLSTYITQGTVVNFSTMNGNTIDVENITYGMSLDYNDEIDFLKEAYEAKKSYDNRVPVLRGYDGEDDSYIEISIDEQHLWHVVNGNICCESDIVTGTQDLHDTPKGVYYISECIDGKYLRGDDYVTWVNKWMRITNRGHGLHDATWRSKFGGDIYTYDGSHGCINLPKNFAYNLFNEVERGARVVIY